MPNKNYKPIEQYWHRAGPFGTIARTTLRTLQFIFAITIAGIYGADLAYATKTNHHAHSEWIYAELVVVLSAITCAIHCFVTVVHVAWTTWDAVLFVLWLAQVGTFGNIYIGDVIQDPYIDATGSITRMRAGIWIGFVNMLLWLLTSVLGVAWCCCTRKVKRRTDMEEVEREREVQRLREEDVECGVVDIEKGDGEDFKLKGGEKDDKKTQKTNDLEPPKYEEVDSEKLDVKSPVVKI